MSRTDGGAVAGNERSRLCGSAVGVVWRYVLLFLVLLLWLATPNANAGSASTNRMARPSLDGLLVKLGYASLPLQRSEGNPPYVLVRYAGKERRFLLDTGCTLNIVDRALAKKLKPLDKSGVTLKDSIREHYDSSDTVVMGELDFGKVKVQNEPAEVMSPNSSGYKIYDGILGGEFLRRHHCVVDCTDPRLYLRTEKPDAAIAGALKSALHGSGYVEVPLTSAGTLVVADCRINDRPARLIVDTGASFTGISTSHAKRFDLTLMPTGLRLSGIGAIGDADAYAAKPRSLTFAGQEMPLLGLHISVADLSSWRVGEKGGVLENVDGMLGAELLAANGGVLVYSTLTLWYQSGTAPAAPRK